MIFASYLTKLPARRVQATTDIMSIGISYAEHLEIGRALAANTLGARREQLQVVRVIENCKAVRIASKEAERYNSRLAALHAEAEQMQAELEADLNAHKIREQASTKAQAAQAA